MSTPAGGSRKLKIIRDIAVACGMVAAIVVIMMWLMGTFSPKIGDRAQATEERPVGNRALATVERIRVPVSESAVGTVRPVHEATIASKLLAKVVAVHVKAGDQVTKDMLLVELDDADLKARREQAAAATREARAAHEQAQTEFDRLKRLIEQGSAAQLETDRATTALKTAEASLQQAEHRLQEADTVLGYAKIQSPTDGIVVEKQIEAGDMAQPGRVLLTLYDPTRMQLVAAVRESLAQRLVIGQAIPVRIDAIDLQCHGQISEIVPEAETGSRSFAVKVTGPCPPGVYAGMFGRLMVPLDEAEILVIPRDAVVHVGQLSMVDAVENGRLHRRAVELGREFDDKVQVLSGLQDGEQVALTAGNDPAKEGA